MPGRRFAAHAPAHPGCSAFALLEDGPRALRARIDLARAAERTLDLQYYIYQGDRAGTLLTYELLRAAERGVQVRILLDDHGLGFGFRERTLRELDAHRNIEVRIFNPTVQRGRLARIVEFLTRMSQLNRRMHNKIFVVDGVAAIIGGRNIGDHYFSGRRRANFRDYDALMFGPAASEAGASFDGFWRSAHAVPVPRLFRQALPEARAGALLARLGRIVSQTMPELLAAEKAAADPVAAWFADPALHWGAGRVVGELPERVEGDAAGQRIGAALGEALTRAEHEVLIESAYFVPEVGGVAVLGALAQRGVRVRVLTNALAASDVPAVHAGYAPYRERLIGAGVELHEFRRHPRGRRWPTLRRIAEVETSLHAKVMVIDRRVAWIGSFNMDPRSLRLNTEVGVLVASERFAAELAACIESDMAAENAWRLELAPATAGGSGLLWRGRREGVDLTIDRDPDVGVWVRLRQALFRALWVFEAQL